MEQATKHTPGPWTILERNQHSAVIGSHASTVVRIHNVGNQFDPEQEANARLIAAAPQLLEALRELEGIMRTAGWNPSMALDRARAALALVQS